MNWLFLLALVLFCLLPLAVTLARPVRLRGRREADLALYRAQRAELDGQLAEGRLEPETHAAALLEVQRRVLAAGPDAAPRQAGGLAALLLVLLLVPAGALGLYLWKGSPGLPDAPFAERMAAAAREEALLAQLRARVESLDPATPTARQGWLLLGNAERQRGRLAEAAEAWKRALAQRFEPALAADTAELELERGENASAAALLARALEADPAQPRLRYLAGLAAIRAGQVENGRAAWRALLADSTPDAPWRAAVEQQLRALP
ncbi:c-type cytochrome biogenesis protein CcmI [Roseomonas sp. BN140053]|uniref:c-type cytochrome biogenesis protein CcmI n=1 Tax=Roseomonas sp. BN140053 TaxID=3391898 RepID=UPI0039E8791B